MHLPVIDRRRLLALGAALPFVGACSAAPAEAKNFPKARTEAEWRKALTREQFYVLRQAGTERAFTSPLDKEKRKGMFHCAGCDNVVYASAAKFDSKTGEVRAKVRWRRERQYGVVFDDTFTLGEFARLAALLQAPALLGD